MAEPVSGLIFVVWLIAPILFGGENQFLQFPGGTEVEIIAPVVEPGQIILARLVQAPDVKRVSIRFGDALYELGPKEQALETFALIGLDLGLKPGPYDLEMTVFLRDGRVEELKHRVLVGVEIFPLKSSGSKKNLSGRPPRSGTASSGRQRSWKWSTASAAKSGWGRARSSGRTREG